MVHDNGFKNAYRITKVKIQGKTDKKKIHLKTKEHQSRTLLSISKST